MSEETHTNNEGKQERETVYLTGDEVYFETVYYLVGGQGDTFFLLYNTFAFKFNFMTQELNLYCLLVNMYIHLLVFYHLLCHHLLRVNMVMWDILLKLL